MYSNALEVRRLSQGLGGVRVQQAYPMVEVSGSKMPFAVLFLELETSHIGYLDLWEGTTRSLGQEMQDIGAV